MNLLLVVALALTALVVVEAMPGTGHGPNADPDALADPDPWGGYRRFGGFGFGRGFGRGYGYGGYWR